MGVLFNMFVHATGAMNVSMKVYDMTNSLTAMVRRETSSYVNFQLSGAGVCQLGST